jgi:exportin-1
MSEEVFDFSNGQMTQAKIKDLKNSFNKEFSLIYQLCEFILERSQKPSLLLATLQTLRAFLTWIPLGYIFGTSMIDTLILKVLFQLTDLTINSICLYQFLEIPQWNAL